MGKTLKELGVQVGDIIKRTGWHDEFHMYVGDYYEVRGGEYGVAAYNNTVQNSWVPLGDTSGYFEIVSRATPVAPPIDLITITTPFGLLDEATQKALKDDGGPYEFYSGDRWFEHGPLWYRTSTYRKKPVPKVETVVLTGCQRWGHWAFDQADLGDTHSITLTFTDGVLDSVAKVEVLK